MPQTEETIHVLSKRVKEENFSSEVIVKISNIINDLQSEEFDLVIVGGLGHVGLPLGIAFAAKGFNVCLFDSAKDKAAIILAGKMPFMEYGAQPVLQEVLEKRKLHISHEPHCISRAKFVVFAIGTPVDEYMNPKTRQFLESIKNLQPYLDRDQIIIIRSTVYPNTCEQISIMLGMGEWNIAYCPERIVQGYAVQELPLLPQIIAGITQRARDEASWLFSHISPKIIQASMGEAELAKLFSNAWRYIQFAVANQFYMISDNLRVDFNHLRGIMMESYGRLATLPSAGFTAGPCLLKDTMQLSAFNNNNFWLGHSAMMVNEGLPNFIVESIKKRCDISKKRIGLLGMAFKADIDDIRDSLSFKLWKILRFHMVDVKCSDEFAKNPEFVSKEELVAVSDIIIIGVHHSAYKNLKFPDGVEVIDLWGKIKVDS